MLDVVYNSKSHLATPMCDSFVCNMHLHCQSVEMHLVVTNLTYVCTITVKQHMKCDMLGGLPFVQRDACCF